MLVLSRKVGESIIIGKDIVVTIVDIRKNHVRVGIEAPREVSVRRPRTTSELEKDLAK
jgi:carbon storage regulator